MADLDQEPDYEALLDALIQRTKEGKLVWEETADSNTFISAVKGVQTFEIFKDESARLFTMAGARTEMSATVVVRVKDGEGKLQYCTPTGLSETANDLYRLAVRIASNVDEKLSGSLELLGEL